MEHPARGSNGHIEVCILADRTLETDFGWVFFYESEHVCRGGHFAHKLVGNAPLIVDRIDGSLHVTGTANPVEFYIEEYRRRT
jgi:hypothetical protein